MHLCASVYMCLVVTCWGWLTSWLSFVVSNCECHFPIGILGQVWYLIVSIPDLCTLIHFIVSLSNDKQADVIDAFNTTFKYLDDILNNNNAYFDNMVSQIYPSELQLNKANTSYTEAAF